MKGFIFIALFVFAVVEGGIFRREAEGFNKEHFHKFLTAYMCKVHGEDFEKCKVCVKGAIESSAGEGDKEAEEAGCKWRDAIETFTKAITQKCADEFRRKDEIKECAEKESEIAKCVHGVFKADHCEFKANKICTENTATNVEECKSCTKNRCLEAFASMEKYFDEHKDSKDHEGFKKKMKEEFDKNIDTCGDNFKKSDEMKACKEKTCVREMIECLQGVHQEFKFCSSDSKEVEDPAENETE